jgi:6-phosphogluconate dehydrogenase
MGTSLAGRASERGHRVVGWDPDGDARDRAAQVADVGVVAQLAELVEQLQPPRFLLLYVPHGDPVDANLDVLGPLLDEGDVVADAGNSHWEDSRRRHEQAEQAGFRFLDIGTSGGTSEALGWEGAAFMVGGPRDAFELVAPVLRDLAVDDRAVHHVGEQPGVGHFVKLVHNAIEFGMIEAIAEGVELLERSDYRTDLPALFEHWNHGTVIRSWLVELMGNALANEGRPDELSTCVEDTGEVKWVVSWATDEDIPLPVVTAAQTVLMQTRDQDWPAAKAVALLRHEFGGHPVHRRERGS